MKFREQLEMARDMGLDICDLAIALECECQFEFDYTAEQFESLCAFARYIYLRMDYTEDQIARTIDNLIYHEGFSIGKVLSMDKYEFAKNILD